MSSDLNSATRQASSRRPRRLGWRGAVAIALLTVAGPVIVIEYLTVGTLTIDVISPRLQVPGEIAAAVLATATLLVILMVTLVLHALFVRSRS